MDNESDHSKTLLLEQVNDLENRTKAAIESGNHALSFSLVTEYQYLIGDSMGNTGSNSKLLGQLFHLRTETVTIPSKSPDDPLVQLKWLYNSIPRLKIIVKRLCPIDTKLELDLHPKVLAASEKLLYNGHFEEAIFAAFKSLEEYVRETSGRNEYGRNLMSKVFNEDSPILKIKYSHTSTERDEQEGFKFIFMGAMVGIRNPKGHHTIIQRDRGRTLQYLALASLLFKTVDDASLFQNDNITGETTRQG